MGAHAKLRKIEEKNQHRLVRTDCHGWQKDALARAGEWIWCEDCEDFTRVNEVVDRNA